MYQLVLSQGPHSVQAGLLLDDILVEYYEYRDQEQEILGDIRLGQVREVVPGINAVFVNVGEERPGFLPARPEQMDGYRPGQEILVQMQRSAVGDKGVVVTDQLSFTGRYLVLTPSNQKLGVSAKITEESERKRLKQAAASFPGKGEVGYVLRTESQGQEEAVLQTEADRLYALYRKAISRGKYSRVGETLYSAGSAVGKLIDGIPASKLDKIVVDDAYLLAKLEEELLIQRPELENRFQLYQDVKWNVLEFYRISSQLQQAMQKRVMIPGGGYLFIEETEALSVIDVNTGKSVRGHQKEEAVASFNVRIVPSIVQQILLRNLSGIIIIDFIDMKDTQHQQRVLDALEAEFQKDRRKTQIFGFTRLGLVEISRERKGLALSKMKR